MEERKYLKKWRANQKKQGLCIDCIDKVVPGKVRCQYHLDLQIEYRKKRGKGLWMKYMKSYHKTG